MLFIISFNSVIIIVIVILKGNGEIILRLEEPSRVHKRKQKTTWIYKHYAQYQNKLLTTILEHIKEKL